MSLADDVAVTKRTLAAQNGPVILVGHSYGGVVITEAGNDPKVAGLVYIAAFAPDKGESVAVADQESAAGRTGAADPAAAGWLSLPRQGEVRRVVRGRRRAGRRRSWPTRRCRGAWRRSAARSRAGVEDEAKLVPRRDRRQDDSARRPARDVQARRLDGRRGQGEPRGLRVAAAGGRDDHHEGRDTEWPW